MLQIARKKLSRAKSRILRDAFAIPLRLQKNRLFRSKSPFAIEIAGAVGLGAILAHACVAMRVANAGGIEDVALSFTSPTYAPSGTTGDWLDTYFVRHGHPPIGMPCLDVAAFPYPEPEPHTPEILWRYGWRPLPDDPKRGGILQFYDWYCSDERTTPLQPKVLAEALGKIVPRRQVRFGARRLTVYHIPDAIDRTWIKNEADHDARTSH